MAPRLWIGMACAAALVAGSAGALAELPRPAPAPQAAPQITAASGPAVAYRRLTEAQYRNTVRDIFGPAIQISAKFEPERREDGLQAVGNARMSITPAGLEQYYAAARAIGDQVIDGKDRDVLIGCKPEGDGAACARQFITARGAQLFRRPLTATEAQQFQTIWQDSAKAGGDFHKALKLTLTGLLMSPEFLFRIERADAAGKQLDAFSAASRISYTLWNTAPDAELMRAASTGELATEAGLGKQVDRLLASPRLQDGVRAYFSDMLEFEAFDNLSKDTVAYPKFSQAVADSAREETLKFLTDHLVARNGDFRDIFTSRDTFIDRTLAYVYGTPYLSTDKWTRHTFPADSERSGVLTQVTFLSLFAHPAASSPTIRGVKLSEIFLCVTIPQPPPDVDFSKVQALEKGTVRTRLLEHMTNPGCAGCHRISDPIGLSLEHFDGLGQRRVKENDQVIDVSAEVDARKFDGAQGLGRYLHDNPRTASCLTRKVQAYALGHSATGADAEMQARAEKAFAAQGYKLPALYRTLLTDPQFYRVTAPALAPAQTRTAALSVSRNPAFGDRP